MRRKEKNNTNKKAKNPFLNKWDLFTIAYLIFFAIFLITGTGRFLSRDGFLMYAIIIFGYYSFAHVSILFAEYANRDRY